MKIKKLYVPVILINRATPKEYNSFLDSMKPRTVTVDGTFNDQFILRK